MSNELPSSLKPLDLPVPDGFERALQCDLHCRYLGFFPDPFGTHLVFDNGDAETAIDERAWEAWLQAPGVRAQVLRAMLDDEWSFLLDTCSRRLYTGKETVTRAFLFHQRQAARRCLEQ